MTFLSSLLPGIREIRAPLISGYIWLLFGWLLIHPAGPDSRSEGPYNGLAEVLAVLGRPGQVAAVSVMAFLTGSLVTAVVMHLIGLSKRKRRYEAEYGFADPEMPHQISSLDDLLMVAGLGAGRGRLPGWRGFMAGSEPDTNVDRAILAISDRELAEEQRRLESSVEDAIRRAGGEAAVTYLKRGTSEMVVLDVPEEGTYVRREFAIPTFSPARDLFSEMAVLRTRLIELNEATGSKVERVHYEAEFRFAVAAALTALVVLFGFDAPWWFLGLVAPVALMVQGYYLEEEGERQLIDAIRARSGTNELEALTPVFARYRLDSSRLREALKDAKWIRLPEHSASAAALDDAPGS